MIDTKLLAELATNASFTNDAILIDASHLTNVRSLLQNFENDFANWASAMNKKATIIKNGSKEIRIPANIAAPNIDPLTIDEPSKLLWFANVAISPGLLVIANDLMNNPRRAGITRLSDELQIIMSDGCNILNPGHSLKEATTWTRSQFWDAQDLDHFRREVKQRGEAAFEYTWRSFDPDDSNKINDLEFTTRYKLFDGGDGNFYQVCENLGMKEIY
ncbi:MAG TPA: hypothetical protein VE944_26645 [Nostoc sp.]|uniref:hypothetical protein n=1 Tax=Nostoc sp. TaxID=1180 RepID=UPI002D6063BD|nr:hypothetical protein [Nostoc sp.]HYX17874.1 hypothetical protein [Nostoc sp.]